MSNIAFGDGRQDSNLHIATYSERPPLSVGTQPVFAYCRQIFSLLSLRAGVLFPDHLNQFRIVDEGIAVALDLIDYLLSFPLSRRDRVLKMPSDEQVPEPWPELLPATVVHRLVCGRALPEVVLIGSGDVEIHSCEVTFERVVRFEDALRCAGFRPW